MTKYAIPSGNIAKRWIIRRYVPGAITGHNRRPRVPLKRYLRAFAEDPAS